MLVAGVKICGIFTGPRRVLPHVFIKINGDFPMPTVT